MWGASLFYLALLVTTHSGQAAMADFFDQLTTQIEAQAPYSYLTLAFAAVYLLTLLAMMRPQEKNELYFIVKREIQGPVFEPVAPAPAPKSSVALWFSRMIQASLKRCWQVMFTTVESEPR